MPEGDAVGKSCAPVLRISRAVLGKKGCPGGSACQSCPPRMIWVSPRWVARALMSAAQLLWAYGVKSSGASLNCCLVIFPNRVEGGKTHCSSVSEAVGSYHPQAHVYEHGNLVSPSHGEIGEAMDLWRICQRVWLSF